LVRNVLGALVVLPTRELAIQVYEVFATLSPALGLWTAVAAARLPLPAEAAALMESHPNILIATPGRLMSHLKAPNSSLSLSGLKFLVSLVVITNFEQMDASASRFHAGKSIP
jgi:superfamily II DNA/RNA helicase